MRRSLKWSLVALGLLVPLSAQAHRSWLLPSATVLSGPNVWVTIDAAVSNSLFVFEHFPLRLANIGPAPDSVGGRGRGADLVITAPDGSQLEAQNGAIGRYRSTFDIELKQAGTYKIAAITEGVFARYKVGKDTKRWRGTAEEFAKQDFSKAEDLVASAMTRRMETFVTAGRPTTETLKPTGRGLELEPITHPNDLVAESTASFRMLMDNEPAADVKVTIIRGGERYRDDLGAIEVKTDSDGKFTVTWPEPGMYWLEAGFRDEKSKIKGVKERRAGYVATLEVLPP